LPATPSWLFPWPSWGPDPARSWCISQTTGSDGLKRRQIPLLALFALAIVVSLWFLLQIEFVPQKIEDPATRLVRENLSFVQRSALLQRNPELFKSWKLYGAIPLAFLPFLLAGYLQAIIFRSAPKKFGQMYGVDLDRGHL
jgi:hypothetical protein